MWLAVSGFMVMGLVSGLSLANHSDSESFLVAQHRSVKMDASERDSGKWMDKWFSFWPFWNSSGWWWLISSLFLTRISCCKTSHVNGYQRVWPGWAVSVSVLPLTLSRVIQTHSLVTCNLAQKSALSQSKKAFSGIWSLNSSGRTWRVRVVILWWWKRP